MFNCYLHGWSSLRSKCPKCIRYEISTSMNTQELKIYMPDKNHELESRIKELEEENKRFREALTEVMKVSGTSCLHYKIAMNALNSTSNDTNSKLTSNNINKL